MQELCLDLPDEEVYVALFLIFQECVELLKPAAKELRAAADEPMQDAGA